MDSGWSAWRGATWGRLVATLAVVAIAVAGWRAYGWAGLALALGGVCMWALLRMNRMLMVLRRAAARPVGSVASAVMLQARLQLGMPLLQVLALTQSLGHRLEGTTDLTEVYVWGDCGGDRVRCTFTQGKLVHWNLQRG